MSYVNTNHPDFKFEIPDFQWTLVDTPDKIYESLKEIEDSKLTAFDFETTGLDYVTSDPAGLSIATADNSWYFHGPQVLELISPWLMKNMTDPKGQRAGHNIKFDLHYMHKLGVNTNAMNIIDTEIAQWLVDENWSLALKDLARLRLGVTEKLASFKNLQSYTKKLTGAKRLDQVSIWDIPLELLAPYAALDSRLTYDLWQNLRPELIAEQQEGNFFNFQMPLIKVLLNMENNGAPIDHERAQEINDTFGAELDDLRAEWDKRSAEYMDGEAVNPNSPDQLGKLLYGPLKLKTNRKTGAGKPSTDALTLIQIGRQDKSGMVKLLQDIKKIGKLVSTYTGSLLNRTHDGRIYTNFNPVGAITGRLSSSGDINLQNIPVRGERGKLMRSVFVAKEGYTLLGIDYSQIELRLLTHFSRDPKLVEAYLWGADVHQMTADWMKVPRYVGKTVNFGTIYGQGPNTLADTIEKDGNPRPKNTQCKVWLNEYDNLYKGVAQWKSFEVAATRRRGYTETIAGRRRHVEGLDHWDNYQRARAERQVINSKIQGSAGDVIGMPMIWLDKLCPEYGAKMLLQVHDELLFEVPNEVIGEFSEVVQNSMTSVREYFNISVPIMADPSIGQSWSEAKG